MPASDRRTTTVSIALQRQLAALLAAGLSACTGAGSVPKAQEDAIRALVDEGMIVSEPLCLEAGPFPVDSGAVKGTCDKCQALYAQGFLTRMISDDEYKPSVRYDLSDLGRRAFVYKADPELLALVRRRFDEQGRRDETVDAKALGKSRLCFGRTRFHSITDALAPITFGGTKVFSAKVVTEVRDTSGLLFDPRIRALGLPVPEAPEPGAPALHPPQVWSFQVFPDGSLDVSDMRYGRWLDEP